MAGKHELIQAQLLIDWSVNRRGRLYNMRQAKAIIYQVFKEALKKAIATRSFKPLQSLVPIWFGPSKQSFHGFPDVFGFETVEIDGKKYPIYCVIDVKTLGYSTLSKEQKNYMSYIKSIGGFAYIAMESKQEGELYYLKEFSE